MPLVATSLGLGSRTLSSDADSGAGREPDTLTNRLVIIRKPTSTSIAPVIRETPGLVAAEPGQPGGGRGGNDRDQDEGDAQADGVAPERGHHDDDGPADLSQDPELDADNGHGL